MNISINKKEYDAINFALNQIQDAIEGASDEEYISCASEASSALYNIIDKYKQARYSQQCRDEENAKIKKIMEDHPYETRGMTVAQVKRLIYRGKK